jgi:DNA-binding beta-propeller fold protein YncE
MRSSWGMARSVALAVAIAAMALVAPGGVASATAPAPGDRLWAGHYDGSGHFLDQAMAIAVSPDGTRVFETGESEAANISLSYVTVARDAATGQKIWASRYRGRSNTIDTPWAIAVSPDGATVFVTGESTDTPNIHDYATVAYDTTTGIERWTARFDDGSHGEDTAQSIAVSPDGNRVFVTGYADAFSDHPFAATLAYNAVTGEQDWKANITGADSASAAKVVASSSGDRVFVLGSRDGQALSVAYDATTGARLWTGEYQRSGDFNGFQSGAVSSDGSTLYVVGASRAANDDRDYETIAYDALTGRARWHARFDNASHGDDRPSSIAVSPDGSRVFVTGTSDEGFDTATHVTTLAYDTTDGHRLWRSLYSTGQFATDARTIAVSPDGSRVVVSGSGMFAQHETDYVTNAYDTATGARIWRSRYGRGQNLDVARGMVIDPTGSRVFVTGGSGDYATVAFSL